MIDKELAAFLEEGISIQLGTRNAALEPNGVRVSAVTVESDGSHVIAYVPKVSAAQVLPDLEANGQAALVFARPIDDRACQVKGVFAGSRAATRAERALVARQWEQFLAYLDAIGLRRVAVDGWISWPCVAIRVRVAALFNQTPGPGAGAAIP